MLVGSERNATVKGAVDYGSTLSASCLDQSRCLVLAGNVGNFESFVRCARARSFCMLFIDMCVIEGV